jgi:hypothetical protein
VSDKKTPKWVAAGAAPVPPAALAVVPPPPLPSTSELPPTSVRFNLAVRLSPQFTEASLAVGRRGVERLEESAHGLLVTLASPPTLRGVYLVPWHNIEWVKRGEG